MIRVLSYVAVVLFVVEVLLCLVSWIVCAVFPECGFRSIISAEGIRWALGTYSEMLATPLLVSLVLAAVAIGAMADSGLLKVFTAHRRLKYRERIASYFVLCMAIAYVLAVVALAALPHAVLLSSTGRLFPSPFSRSLVPVACFGVSLLSVIYGIVSGHYRTVYDVFKSLFVGIGKLSPLFVIYILLAQLYYSFCFVVLQNTN